MYHNIHLLQEWKMLEVVYKLYREIRKWKKDDGNESNRYLIDLSQNTNLFAYFLIYIILIYRFITFYIVKR